MFLGVNPDFCEKDPFLQPATLKRGGFACADFGKFVDTEGEFFKQSDEAFFSSLAALRRAYEEAGIKVWQTHSPWRCPARDFTPDDREERFSAMARSVRGTAALGCSYMVIHPIMPFGENVPDCPEEVLRINREFFTRLCDVADEVGVTVCLENMPFTHHPLAHPRDIAAFVRGMNRDSLKMCFDTGHTTFYGDAEPAGVLREYRDIIRTLHVHDNCRDGRDAHAEPYTGCIDWDAFAEALADCPDIGCLSLELHGVSPEEREAAIKAAHAAGERLLRATGRK